MHVLISFIFVRFQSRALSFARAPTCTHRVCIFHYFGVCGSFPFVQIARREYMAYMHTCRRNVTTMCLEHSPLLFFRFIHLFERLQNKQRSTEGRKKINKQQNELQRIEREGEKQIPNWIIIPVDIKNNKKIVFRKCKKKSERKR